VARKRPPKQVKYRPYPKYPFPRLRGLRARLSPRRVVETAAWTRGGSWTSLIFLLVGARMARKAVRRKPEVLAVDKLAPGQSITIITAPRRSGKQR
jgi:hypothetical protein